MQGAEKESAKDEKENDACGGAVSTVRHPRFKTATRNNFSSSRECKERKKGSAEGGKTGARTNKNLCAEGTERKDYKK